MKGVKVPKSETVEIIAYECKWCGRAFRERTLSRHRCGKKALVTGQLDVSSPNPFKKAPVEPASEAPF